MIFSIEIHCHFNPLKKIAFCLFFDDQGGMIAKGGGNERNTLKKNTRTIPTIHHKGSLSLTVRELKNE